MSLTYEANLNCDGKDCKTRPVTGIIWEDYRVAAAVVKHTAKEQDWVFIEDEHYCPDCAEKVT